MISATVIDAMLAAGASCDQLAIIARQHFPELAQTVDALISAGSDAIFIGQLLKACKLRSRRRLTVATVTDARVRYQGCLMDFLRWRVSTLRAR
jgi:hypothetical protein